MHSAAFWNTEHLIPVEAAGKRKNGRRKQRFAKLMKRSEKSNESPGDKPDTLDALPIGCNHSQKFASYVDECSGRQVHYTKDGLLR